MDTLLNLASDPTQLLTDLASNSAQKLTGLASNSAQKLAGLAVNLTSDPASDPASEPVPSMSSEKNVSSSLVDLVTTNLANLAPSMSSGMNMSPSPVDLVAANVAPSLSSGKNVSPSPVDLVAANLTPSMSSEKNVSPSPVDLVVANPTPSMSNREYVSPSPVDLVAANPAPSMSNREYVSPSPVDLVVVRRALGDILKDGKITITDTNGNVVFKVKANLLNIRGQLLLANADGKPIFTLQRRMLSMHDRWEAYKGESAEDCDLMFTVKKCAVVQMKSKLQVFMAKNTDEYACDYRVEGGFLQNSCTIYVGETKTIVAQMYRKMGFENLVGKERFALTVYPNVDQALIAALIVILDGINRPGWI